MVFPTPPCATAPGRNALAESGAPIRAVESLRARARRPSPRLMRGARPSTPSAATPLGLGPGDLPRVEHTVGREEVGALRASSISRRGAWRPASRRNPCAHPLGRVDTPTRAASVVLVDLATREGNGADHSGRRQFGARPGHGTGGGRRSVSHLRAAADAVARDVAGSGLVRKRRTGPPRDRLRGTGSAHGGPHAPPPPARARRRRRARPRAPAPAPTRAPRREVGASCSACGSLSSASVPSAVEESPAPRASSTSAMSWSSAPAAVSNSSSASSTAGSSSSSTRTRGEPALHDGLVIVVRPRRAPRRRRPSVPPSRPRHPRRPPRRAPESASTVGRVPLSPRRRIPRRDDLGFVDLGLVVRRALVGLEDDVAGRRPLELRVVHRRGLGVGKRASEAGARRRRAGARCRRPRKRGTRRR